MVRPFSPRNRIVSPGSILQRNAISKAKELVAKGELYRASKHELPASKADKVETQLQLKNAMYRFIKNNDRIMMLRLLEDSKLLRNIALPKLVGPLADDEAGWLKLEEEVTQSKIMLNHVKLGGSSNLQKKEMLRVMEKICDSLACESSLSTEQIFQAAILRLTRSIAANDAYFLANALLGSPDLKLLPSNDGPPTHSKLDVFACSGSIHMQSETLHSYGLLRKVDLSTRAKRPWINLLVTVHERIKLSNQQSVRYCTVKVAEKLGFV
ncbi:hypothetical protein MPSEU_001034000 [Mayamaea pseudoterrestris]|nr:hypothetical protein MPSEU_001034000 [Mayamaea pseudoterrestris]